MTIDYCSFHVGLLLYRYIPFLEGVLGLAARNSRYCYNNIVLIDFSHK